MFKLSESVNRKFIDTIDVSDWQVETEDGFVDIQQLHTTIEYEVYEILLDNNTSLKCADTHIIIDENNNEVFAMDSLGCNVITKHGIAKVTSVRNLGYSDNMYDLSIDSDKHTYYTNDILSHNTTSLVAAVLHYSIFNDEKTTAILANKKETAIEILNRVQLAYENLPNWMQMGVVTFNKSSIVLENKTRIMAFATSSAGIRGYSINFLFIDECAHIEGWNEFFTSVYPTISSGKESKVVLVSTPLGLNFYHKLWEDAVNGRSDFTPIKVTWKDVPGRDEEWKRQTIANTSEEAFIQEHEAEFVGSSGTLIDGWRLKELVEWNPIAFNKTKRKYKDYVEGDVYCISADVSRGKGLDNSAFIVVNISRLPYEVVYTYYCDTIPPDIYAEIIHNIYLQYGRAIVLVENNDAGCETLRMLNDIYECEEILGTMTDSQGNKVLSINGGRNFNMGLSTSKSTKAIGCSRLKHLIENYAFLFGDKIIIEEANKFIRQNNSYSAQKDAHDDIMMACVNFAWLTTQSLFQEISNVDTRKAIREHFEDKYDQDLLPLGYITDGMNTYGDDDKLDYGYFDMPDYDEELLEYNNIQRNRNKDSFDVI